MQRSIPFLWGLVIILLTLNLALLYGLNRTRLTVIKTLSEVETTLDKLANEVIVYNIEVSQPVPIKADVPLKQTMEIPLNTVIPIDQELTVPFQTGSDEIEIDMPLKTDFPLKMVIPVDFDQVINVDTIVELNTIVPVEIEIGKTPLAGYLEQARANVAQLRNSFTLRDELLEAKEPVYAAVPANEATVVSHSSANNDAQVPSAAAEAVAKATPFSVEPEESYGLNEPPVVSTRVVSQSNDTAVQSDLGWCTHIYWPLRPGTTWTYSSLATAYTQHVSDIVNNQVFLSSQYAGQDIQFSLVCYKEGLGGEYIGDMRRIAAFGDLTFRNSRGLFLPRPDVVEHIGSTWTQNFEVTGTVQARQGDKLVSGNISRGQAVAVYTPTNFEILDTPLGPREAVRIEQKLDFDLAIEFEVSHETIHATEAVNLTTIYWFVKGIGLVKMHWQGGAFEQVLEIDGTPTTRQLSVPALAEEYLVSVCVMVEGESFECMEVADIPRSAAESLSETVLDVPGFVLPVEIDKDDSVNISQTVDRDIPQEEAVIINDFPQESASQANSNHDQSALLAYAKAATDLGEKINEAGETFGQAAINYRNGQITLGEFQNKFNSFVPKVQSYIKEVNKLSSPPQAETIHQKLTSGLNNCNKGIDLMDDWFDSQDSDTRDATVILVGTCIDQVTRAANELQTLINEN